MFLPGARQDGSRLGFGQSPHVIGGSFTGQERFIHVGDIDSKHPSAQRKELPAPRGIGSQQKVGYICHKDTKLKL
jgi:hypothetical protein